MKYQILGLQMHVVSFEFFLTIPTVRIDELNPLLFKSPAV